MTSQPVLRPLGPLQSSCRPLSGRCGTVWAARLRSSTARDRCRAASCRAASALCRSSAALRRSVAAQLTLGAGDLPIDHPLLPAGQQRRIVGTQTAAGHLVTNHSSLVTNHSSLIASLAAWSRASAAWSRASAAWSRRDAHQSRLTASSSSSSARSSRSAAAWSRSRAASSLWSPTLSLGALPVLLPTSHRRQQPCPRGIVQGGQPSDNSEHARPARTQEGQAFPAANQRIRPITRSPPASPASCRDPSTGDQGTPGSACSWARTRARPRTAARTGRN